MKKFAYPLLSASFVLVFFALQAFPQQITEPPRILFPQNNTVVKFPGTNALFPFSWEPVAGADSYIVGIRIGTRLIPPITTTNTSIEVNLNLQLNEFNETVIWAVTPQQNNRPSQFSTNATFFFASEGTPIPGSQPFGTPTPGGTVIPTGTPGPSVTPTMIPPPTLVAPPDNIDFSPVDALNIDFRWRNVTGAFSYRFRIFEDNSPIVNRDVPFEQGRPETHVIVSGLSRSIFKVFQWDVRTVNTQGQVGPPSQRRAFSIGKDIYPTPTAMPATADLNGQNGINAQDVYHFAVRYKTNDPLVDYNQNGISDPNDLLRFIELYKNGRGE